MQVKAGREWRKVHFPGSGIFLVGEQSSGQVASVSALYLSVASSQGQRKNEHEQLLLLTSVSPGEMQEGGGTREDMPRSALWHREGSDPLWLGLWEKAAQFAWQPVEKETSQWGGYFREKETRSPQDYIWNPKTVKSAEILLALGERILIDGGQGDCLGTG